MRGFLTGVLALTFLDLLLRVPGGAFTTAIDAPTGWLAKWMDPAVPLISRPVPGAGGTAAGSGGSSTETGLDAGNPAARHVNQLGESTDGACPFPITKGMPKNLRCAAA